MKKLVIIATALFLIAGYTASAQTGHDHNNKQDQNQSMMMHEKGEMQDMMNNGMCPMCGQMMDQNMPIKKYGMIVNQLPKMQQQLSLNDNQIEQLNELQAGFKKQQIDFQSELKKKQTKLKSLLDDMAPATQIEKQMQDYANTEISMKVAAYETAGKMKAVLNNDQKEQLKNKMMQHDGMMMQHDGMMNQGKDSMMQKHDGMMNHNHDEKMQK